MVYTIVVRMSFREHSFFFPSIEHHHWRKAKNSYRPPRQTRPGKHPEAWSQAPGSLRRLLEGPWDALVVRYAVRPRQAGLLHRRALPQWGFAEVPPGEPVLEDLWPLCDSVAREGYGYAETWGIGACWGCLVCVMSLSGSVFVSLGMDRWSISMAGYIHYEPIDGKQYDR